MHESVLMEETLFWLRVRDGGRYVDGTVGGGGHTAAIVERAGPQGRVLGLDQDPQALERAQARLADFSKDRWTLVRGNFSDMAAMARHHGMEQVDGILLDLGVSSDQLAMAQRGFSFMRDGPLDMRMDPDAPVSAATLVASLSEEELAGLLRAYGEERRARRVAGAIMRERAVRPIETTEHLASVAARAVGGRKGRIHPATRTFQALRMAVNRELECLKAVLSDGLELLGPGGRMVVISFHSLEDREVKRCFRAHAGRQRALQAGGAEWEGLEPRVRVLTRKPVEASERERAGNARSRSAKLRAAERIS
jgi:16S rRNA (cytosine1402-N4)-methyltransferase